MRTNSKLIILFYFIGFYCLQSQNKVYYDEFWNPTSDNLSAQFYTILEKSSNDTNEVVERNYYLSNQIKSEIHFSNYSRRTRNGIYRAYHPNGKLKESAYYSQNRLIDSLKTFWDNGTKKREDFYIDGKFQSGKMFNSDGTEVPHYDYEIMPEFEGGLNELIRYLSMNIKYPKVARKKGISGKVYIQFMVDKAGSIKNVKVLKGVSEELDAEAIRVVSAMPKWKPGLLDGDKVNTYFNLPISFKLD